MKEKKGITLIALIVTVIIMLILAGITVNLILNGGIIDRANEAADAYQIAADKEALQIAIASSIDAVTGKVVKKDLEDNLPEKWNVASSGDSFTCESPDKNCFTVSLDGTIELQVSGGEDKTQDMAYLRDFFGTKGERINLFDLVEETNDGYDIFFIDHNIELLSMFYEDDNEEKMSLILKYNNAAYELKLEYYEPEEDEEDYEYGYDDEMMPVILGDLNLVYTPTGREGKTVKYSYDGTEENMKSWTILYDNGNDVELVSPDVIDEYTIGEEYSKWSDEGNIDTNKINTIVSNYNDAVEELNSACEALVSNSDSNILSVRSVGANSQNSSHDNEELYSSSELEKIFPELNGKIKMSDENYKQDYVRMLYWNELMPQNMESYWWASRNTQMLEMQGYDSYDSTRLEFTSGLYNVYEDGYCSINDIINVSATIDDNEEMSDISWEMYEETEGLRPVIKLKYSGEGNVAAPKLKYPASTAIGNHMIGKIGIFGEIRIDTDEDDSTSEYSADILTGEYAIDGDKIYNIIGKIYSDKFPNKSEDFIKAATYYSSGMYELSELKNMFNLEEIEWDTIGYLKNDLSEEDSRINNTTIIGKYAFQGIKSINYLSINANYLEKIEVDAFKDSKIEQICISSWNGNSLDNLDLGNIEDYYTITSRYDYCINLSCK